MHASHFRPATECHRCPCSSQQRAHIGARAAATQPTDASHSRVSCPNSEIRPTSTWIERATLRVGNHLRHASPDSFSFRSWIAAYFASQFAEPPHAILSCTKWNSQCCVKTLTWDRWPMLVRRHQLNRPDRLHRLTYFADDLKKLNKSNYIFRWLHNESECEWTLSSLRFSCGFQRQTKCILPEMECHQIYESLCDAHIQLQCALLLLSIYIEIIMFSVLSQFPDSRHWTSVQHSLDHNKISSFNDIIPILTEQ